MKLLVKVSAIVIGVSLSMVSAAEEALRDSSVSSIEDADFASNTGSSQTNSNESAPPKQCKAGVKEASYCRRVKGVTEESFFDPISGKIILGLEFEIENPETDIISISFKGNRLYMGNTGTTQDAMHLMGLNDFFNTAQRHISLSAQEQRAAGRIPVPVKTIECIALENSVTISKESSIYATQLIFLQAGTCFDFHGPNVFACGSGEMFLIFTNPESVMTQMLLEWDPAKSYKSKYASQGSDQPDLCLGSIWGKASFLPGEDSGLHFKGFKKVSMYFNKHAVRKLKEEGRLGALSNSK